MKDQRAAGNDSHPADRGEASKSASKILQQLISEGCTQLERPSRGLILSSLSAGLDLSFGPLLVVTVISMTASPAGLTDNLLLAVLYSVGFVIVILGRSELFTEHTTLATLPLLAGVSSWTSVARLWALVYTGNIVGTVAFSLAAAPLGIALGLFEPTDLEEVAGKLAQVSWWVLLGSAVVAGWLMGLVSWLVTASRETTSQILVIVMVAGSIGFLGLHHSIAGSTEVLLGVVGAGLPVSDWLRFLVLATIGNAIGGTTFVSLLKFGHSTRD